MNSREIKYRVRRQHSDAWDYISLFEAQRCAYDFETLGQYTGLKDANEVEIWEGDILSNEIIKPSQVFFEHGCFFFQFNPLAECLHLAKLKVVGNIYQNEELLK